MRPEGPAAVLVELVRLYKQGRIGTLGAGGAGLVASPDNSTLRVFDRLCRHGQAHPVVHPAPVVRQGRRRVA